MKLNPKLSVPKIASTIADKCKKHVNPETIRRIIRRAEYNGRVAWRKSLINEQNRKILLQFARERYLKQETWWTDVIFCDESKFYLFGSDGRTMVWRKPNEELKKLNLHATVKHGDGGVMVWGCFSASGVGNLVFIEGTLNKEGYVKILQDNVLQSPEKMGLGHHFKFWRYNDPKH